MASWLRLGADIVHLLGALCWVGALALFAALLWQPRSNEPALAGDAARALANFALAGTMIVGLLAATGTANLLFLVPLADLPYLLVTLYGCLLVAKLMLTVVMIGLAALNRFVLVPALERAQHDRGRLGAISRLRLSVTLELVAALAVLGLVAWLGTLDPLAIGNGP
jgi:putative copper resistance protein D